jgi:hypothetical protein
MHDWFGTSTNRHDLFQQDDNGASLRNLRVRNLSILS